MEQKSMHYKLLGIIIGISILMAGCSGRDVKSSVVSTTERDSIVQDLSDRPGDFNAFQCSNVVFFTPVNTDKRLDVVGLQCRDLDPQEGLDRFKRGQGNFLHKISGPNEDVWGYYGWIFKTGNIGTKMKDEKTLQLYYYPIHRGGP